MKALFETALAELGDVTSRLNPDDIDTACTMIGEAGKIVLYGCGREGLQLRGFTMRLYHLGLNATTQGEMSTPPVGRGDLLVVSAGPGELSTVNALIGVARTAGAGIHFLTAEPDAPASALADLTLQIPAQTMARDQKAGATSVLPMGSVYEGALFLLFEIMVLRLRDILGVTPSEMRARHTNLE